MRNAIAVLLLLFISTLSTSVAARPGEENQDEKVFPDASWPVAVSPEDLGWSTAKLKKAKVFSNRIGSAAVMIVDNGIVVDQWGDISLKYPIHSIRKPLMSSLVGIHAQLGRIDLSRTLEELGIDDTEPSLTGLEKQATIRDLMMSRSGVYHVALGEVYMMKQARPKRGSHSPGAFWYYNNWDFNAVGTIFEKETGTEIFEEFTRRIAEPLQMQDFKISDGKYISGTESIHRVYAFRLSARDLARFGLLYLRNGKWKADQIVPHRWVRESTATASDIGLGRGYGYMWRTAVKGGLAPNVHLSEHCFFHSGAGLHYLIVIPKINLVIVHRVSTDADGPYPRQHQIGRLFWMILDAAGQEGIGENPSLEASTGGRLNEEKLETILTASKFRVVVPLGLVEGGDRIFTVQFSTGGYLSVIDDRGRSRMGKWLVREEKTCVEWEDLKECFSAVKGKDSVKLYDHTNTLFTSMSILSQ